MELYKDFLGGLVHLAWWFSGKPEGNAKSSMGLP